MNTPRASLIAVLILFTAIAFLPSLKGGFTNYDDDVLVTENRLVREFGLGTVGEMFLSPYNGLYHPLVLLSYGLEHRFFGPDPFVFHVTNLLLHLLNTALVFLLLFKLSGDETAAAVAALLFAVHPLHVESVAWISERKDVLCGSFFLSSLIAYLSFKEHGRRSRYAASLLFFLASLLSKAMAITLPAVLLLIDYYRGDKPEEKLKEKLPFFGLSVLFGAIALLSHYRSGTVTAGPSIDIVKGMATAVNSLVFYLAKLAAPVNLSCLYPYSGDGWSGFYPFPFIAPAVLAVIAVLALRAGKYGRAVPFGSLFFAATIFPVLQLVPVGQELPADRYAYLPSIGLFFIAGAFLSLALRHRRKLQVPAVAAVIIVAAVLSGLTRQRCRVWNNSVALWNDAAARFPFEARIYKNRADAYKSRRDHERAMEDYRRALSLKSDYAEALNNRGNLYAGLKDHDAALRDLTAALDINPSYANALYNRALVRADRGDHAGALADYSRLIGLRPGYAEAYNNRGTVHARLGRLEPAIEDFSAALRLRPSLSEARMNRARSYCLAKDYLQARQDALYLKRQGYSLDPEFEKTLNACLAGLPAAPIDNTAEK
ncbi:MAG: tetratricopeptide repeat protein [Endomicrobiales bacterium]